MLHEGRLVIERYFVADDVDSMLPATVIARPLAAMAAGVALADGTLKSLDAPVAALLHEWDDEPRGRITLRQLLEETSGLEDGNTIAGVLYQSPWQDLARLPRFATARGVRMWLGNDYESSALGFRLNHESGGFYNVSPANAQLVAVMLERATGQPYERFVDTRIWSAAGAGTARLQLDRRAGMPAAHCCWLATARDMLRIATLLATDGNTGNRQVLPAGWVAEMAQPSRVNADSGMQLRRLKIEGEDALSSADDQGSAFWVIPSRQLCWCGHRHAWRQQLDECRRWCCARWCAVIDRKTGSQPSGATRTCVHGHENRTRTFAGRRLSRQPRIRAHDPRHRIHRGRILATAEIGHDCAACRVIGIPFQSPVPSLDGAHAQAVPRRSDQPRRFGRIA